MSRHCVFMAIVVAHVTPLGVGVLANTCSVFHSNNFGIPNKYLKDFILKTEKDILFHTCMEMCAKKPICSSINFHMKNRTCEINLSDHVSHPDHFSIDTGWMYVYRDKIPTNFAGACSTVTCPPGKTCSGTRQIVLGCVQTECGPAQPVHDTIVPMDSHYHSVGDTISYKCKNNGLAVDGTESVCLPDGSWSSVNTTGYHICVGKS